ncbi:Phytanoyl-CoA dioxygenase (PhyH) [Seminavis robusta]|uniref:Phytanoyl-CoA dioxygenase (PhyH) n=1 Tax=Seminavis robusta TaxID=568900 RepID=A0A9N8DRE5_9STRA|nr:Phytanoyl-CoA dioxygenase (PhyH) [Seminavis robusta]|eukprot:Sro316_g115630.1 Phytanoyl-CoA dioxygenase (PhyH) (349) ;mRNA; r:76174-77220
MSVAGTCSRTGPTIFSDSDCGCAAIDHDFSFRVTLPDSPSATATGLECNDAVVVPLGLKTSFDQDGFVAIPNVLDESTVKALNERLECVLLQGDYNRNQPPDKVPKISATTVSMSTPHKRVYQIINIHKCDCLFHQLATSATLGRVVAQLAGWTSIRLAQDQVWAKPPGAAPLVFHRDAPYFQFDDPRLVTVWIALDTMHATLGPLEYVPGSHNWDSSSASSGSMRQFYSNKNSSYDTMMRAAAEREGLKDINVVSMAGLPAGSITIHHGTTWHGSGKNHSPTQPRRGLGLHFVPGPVHFTMQAKKSKLYSKYVPDHCTSDEDLQQIPLDANEFPITWQQYTLLEGSE